jgi:ABC-type transporter Mla subunit MlaD
MQELFENFATNTQAVLGDALGRFNEGVGQMMAWQEAYEGRQEALLAAQEQVHQSMLDAEQAFTAFQHRAEQIAGIVDLLDGAIGRLDQATEGINESLGAIHVTADHFNTAMVQLQNSLAGLPQGAQDAVGEAIGNLNNSIQEFNTALSSFEEGLEKALNHSLASLGNALVSLSERFAEDYTPLTERLREVLSIAEGIERPENVQPEIEEAQ